MVLSPLRPFGRLALTLALLLAFFALGCAAGGSKASLTGKVVYKDAPVTGGRITFHPTGGGPPMTLDIKPDGSLNLSDLPVGESKVTIDTEFVKDLPQVNPGEAPKDLGKAPPDSASKFKPPPDKSGMKMSDFAPSAAVYVAIPRKYRDVNSTPLKVTLKAGKNEETFTLTD